jgi:hypothetical protein
MSAADIRAIAHLSGLILGQVRNTHARAILDVWAGTVDQ